MIWNTHLSQVALYVINSLYNSSYRPLTIAYVYIDELLCITCRM